MRDLLPLPTEGRYRGAADERQRGPRGRIAYPDANRVASPNRFSFLPRETKAIRALVLHIRVILLTVLTLVCRVNVCIVYVVNMALFRCREWSDESSLMNRRAPR